jgi:hypothetical protein
VLLVREQFMGEWTEASATFKANYREAAVAYVEESVTVQVWTCGNTAKDAASR